MTLRIGSLFSGYGGLDMAVQSVLGGELAWVSDIEPASCQVLAAHHPGMPNLGDITTVNWAAPTPVDVLTGGYPCQPFSHAGKRQGKNDERHLWPYVCDAIHALRPRLVVLENVRGHLTLGFGDVLADLSRVGYDARWGVVRASDAGAPHGRARLFIVAHPRGTRSQGFSLPAAPVHGAGQERAGADGGAQLPANPARGAGGTWSGRGVPEPQGTAGSAAYAGGAAADAPDNGLQHPGKRVGAGRASAAEGRSGAATDADGLGHEWGGAARDGWTGPADDHLPAADANRPGSEARGDTGRERERVRVEPVGPAHVDWGKYAPAIHRWESVLGRPAPSPTIPGANGRPRLSPAFVEWMMGLPSGHVTGHGLRPAQELKMLGNGVVPQQAALALRMLGVAP